MTDTDTLSTDRPDPLLLLTVMGVGISAATIVLWLPRIW